MKKKMLLGLCVCGMILAGCQGTSEQKEEKEISLDIVIEDKVNGKELLNETITQTGEIENLYDFLEKCEELEIEFEEGSYGTYIEGMMGLEQDFDKGPWWLYSSENNEACQAEGMCPAVKDLEIKDGDQFVFSYTNEF